MSPTGLVIKDTRASLSFPWISHSGEAQPPSCEDTQVAHGENIVGAGEGNAGFPPTASMLGANDLGSRYSTTVKPSDDTALAAMLTGNS